MTIPITLEKSPINSFVDSSEYSSELVSRSKSGSKSYEIDLSERFVGFTSAPLSPFEMKRIKILNNLGFCSNTATIINLYCIKNFEDDFYKISQEVPYDPSSYPSCSLLIRVTCCFRTPRIPCFSDFTRKGIDKLNNALMAEDLPLATKCYQEGIRWNAYPFHEHFESDYDCHDMGCSSAMKIDLSHPFRVMDGCRFIRELAQKNKQQALFWIIKQASQLSYSDSWEIASNCQIEFANGLYLPQKNDWGHRFSSAPFWMNHRYDPFSHAYVAALIRSLYDDSSTAIERAALLRAFLMRYPLEKFPKTPIQLEKILSGIAGVKSYKVGTYGTEELPICRLPAPLLATFHLLQCKEFLLHLVVEHFKRAVRNSEIDIFECVLDNRGNHFSVMDFLDHSKPGSPHLSYSYPNAEFAKVWIKYGFKA